MAHGAPDLSDLMAVFEEHQQVATTLHQISSGQNVDVRQGVGNLPFPQTGLPFSTDLDPQTQLSQIPELDHALPGNAFLSSDIVREPSARNNTLGNGSEGIGSLGSLFLSSIESQIDPVKNENPAFNRSIPQHNIPKAVTSKPTQQNPSNTKSTFQQIRTNNMSHSQRNPAKSKYSQYGNNLDMEQATVALHTTAISSGELAANSNMGSLPFIVPSEVQPIVPHFQLGATQKKVQSNQFVHPLPGTRQQPVPTNPPRPLSAASSTSEHLSRPGSVQQPSPTCGSNHSGDPATPLTPQSYNAGTPIYYKPATPGVNASVQQHTRTPGYMDMHHSPQIQQVVSPKTFPTPQHSVVGFQSQPPPQPIMASNEALNELPTPIKDALDPVNDIGSFHNPNGDIDPDCLWGPESAVMSPNSLFVNATSAQSSSNLPLIAPDQNIGFGYSNDVYGTGFASYPNRFQPRDELPCEESLTEKQNAILEQLSSSGMKKAGAQTMQQPSVLGQAGNKSDQFGVPPSSGTSTIDLMNKATNAGHATVEKLLGSQYEAISPVSDPSMSPASRSNLPDELADAIFAPPKFTSPTDLPSHPQDHRPPTSNQPDPVLMYVTKDGNRSSQDDLSNFLANDNVPELIHYSETGWPSQPSVPKTSITTSQMQPISSVSNHPTTANVSLQEPPSFNQWNANMNIMTPNFGMMGNSQQSSRSLMGASNLSSVSDMMPAHSVTTSQNVTSRSQVVTTKDRKPFGVVRHKSGADRGKTTAKSGTVGGSSDPTFGFESDDEAESICLNKVTPVTTGKKAPKQPQLNSSAAKPRMAFSIPASDDLRQQMETVKQLQQQQLRLQQIQAFQSQNVPSTTPVSQAKHLQTRVQPKSATVNPPLHHDFLRTKKVTEAPVMRVNHTVAGATPYTSAYISHTISTPSNAQRLLSKPAPLSLAQPNPGYGDSSRYKQAQQAPPILSQTLFPPPVPRLPNFSETLRMSSDSFLHSVTSHHTGVKDDKIHVPPSSVLYPLHSVSASTLPLQIPATLPPKSIVAPSAISSLLSSVQVQSSSALVDQVPTTFSSLTSMQSDNVNMNLDWLNKEPDRIVAEKTQTPIRDFRNASTPPNTVPPPSSIAPRGNHLLFSSDSSARLPTRRLPEDDAMPLKQSIHTVDHLSVPKTHAVVSTTFTPATAPKRHLPNETRHLNFKKHRILEGVLPSTNIKPTPTTSSISTFTPSRTSVTVAHSVLDKQRQYMKEHSSQRMKQKQPQAPESTPATAAVTFTSKESMPSNMKKTSAVEKNKTKQGNKSGSMFMLFDSLLQEASSESPAKSTSPSKEKVDKLPVKASVLPEKIPDKPPTNVPKEQKSAKPPVSMPLPKEKKLDKSPSKLLASETKSDKPMEIVAAKNDTSNKPKTSVVQSDIVKPKPAVSFSPVVSISPVSVTSSIAANATTHTVAANRSVNEIKKPAKKNWSTSAMPFKRRYFDDAQSKLRAASKAPVTTVVTTVPVSKSKTSVPAVKVSVSKAVEPTTLSVASTVVSKTAVCSAVASSVASSTPASSVSSDTTAAVGSALKLRITAFRSTRGDIIHQSAMLSKEEEAGGSDRSAPRKSKKRKKKKDKKKRKKTTLSDDDSDASSQSKADQRAKLLEKAKINEQITKELEEIARMAAIKEKEAAAAAAKSSPLKRKRARGNDSDANADAKKTPKRVKISKVIPKKKQDPKTAEPVARYLPKSALQASAGVNVVSSASAKVPITIPSSYQRVPGRLPLYLSTNDGKAIGAPTIQLVARNTSKATAGDNKSLSTPKIVNVKVSSAPRSISTQLRSNTNVQYIIPTSRPQARVIVTNISTSATVSPVIVRSFPGGLVPLSVGSLSTTASTKPQLFSVPLSVNESTLQRNIGAKIIEKLKTVEPSNVSSSRRSHTSVAKQVASSISFLTKSRCTAGLTGTLDTPRVSTKVLSPGSDNQQDASNFQSVLLSLITSPNPVSNYVPSQPPVSLDLSEQESFPCLACEDRFLFRECLKDHHDRRSILIKVRCMQCDKDMVFLNKCKLLMHARQHSDGMQFNNAHISPLPLPMCEPRSKDWFLENSAAANHDLTARQRNISTASSDPDSSVTGAPMSLTCTECNFTASSAETLEEHFQRTSPPPSPDKSGNASKTATFVCDICSVSIPNQCSFMAHMRMHKRAVPHTCPECGQTFDSGVEEDGNSENKREFDFNLHLSVQCFHLSRITAFKCTLCGLICKNAELLTRHLEDRHLQTFYKCRDCPMAFKTQENIASHQRSAHGIVAITKTIYKCPLCDMVFTDNNATQQLFLLQKHFEGHMSHPTIHITAYKCLFCENIYERKSLLRDHLKTVHDVTASGDADLNDPKAVMDSDVNGNSKKDGKGLPGSHKLTRTALIEGSNAQIASGNLGNKELMKKKSGDLMFGRQNAMQPLKLRLKGLGNPVSDSSGSSRDLNNVSSAVGNAACFMRDGKKIFPCGQCAKELLSASARINHVRLKHQGIRTMFCCPHCPAGKVRFAKNISMKKHLRKIHHLEEITKQDVRIEHVKLPIGQRFDPAVLNADEGGSVPAEQTNNAVSSKVRKKFTRPVRKSSRAQRHANLANASLYAENSDSEVEKIMSNRVFDDDTGDRSDQSDAELDFSLLKFPSVYLCAKCEHQSEDRLEFQAHILEHKDDVEMEGITGTIQCTECGLCFASESSHTKHLFIKHKVRKRKLLEKYDTQLKEKRKANGSLPYRLTEGYASNPDGSSHCSIKKHKCTVCFKRFEDGSQLRTHMRTHGLAFVKSKHTS